MIFNPLEQFTIISNLQLTNFTLFVLILIITLLFINILNTSIFPKHLEWWYTTINGNIKNGGDHIYIILSIWLIILISNVIGMIPYSLTLTAQAIFVLSIALPTFLSINILGISIHGFNIFYLFLPSGVPLGLTPIITILELVSYLVRTLSLTLRLSANMIAGHILMKIMIYSFIELPFLSVIIIPIILLEIMVAFLQAYVFLVLSLSYYGDISVPH